MVNRNKVKGQSPHLIHFSSICKNKFIIIINFLHGQQEQSKGTKSPHPIHFSSICKNRFIIIINFLHGQNEQRKGTLSTSNTRFKHL